MKKFREWLSEKDSSFAEKPETLKLEPQKPKRVASDPSEEKDKKDGWQPEVEDMELGSSEKTKTSPKDTIWVQNADQWTEKDRTAK